MKKAEFLEELERALRRARVEDAEEILGEYEQHFAFKEKDGYSEEEIAARLGSPAALAAQFAGGRTGGNPGGGKKAVAVAGLCVTDLLAACPKISSAAPYFRSILLMAAMAATREI